MKPNRYSVIATASMKYASILFAIFASMVFISTLFARTLASDANSNISSIGVVVKIIIPLAASSFALWWLKPPIRFVAAAALFFACLFFV